ncbi:MAG: hypothetical protein KIT43_12435 [Bauldia sp.]|nr:hypothetical protein [Bauldia sp.]
MRAFLTGTIAVALLVSAEAASAGPHDAEIETILTEAATDWSAVLSCSILNPEEHTTILGWWEEEVAELAPLLEEADVAPKLAATFLAGLAPEVLMAPTQGEAAALIAYCSEESDWRRRLALFTIAQPVTDIERLLRR